MSDRQTNKDDVKQSNCKSCGGSGKDKNNPGDRPCPACSGSGEVSTTKDASVKEALDNPFDGYGRPFSDNGNMSDTYNHDNPAQNVGPYAGPSSYSINTVAPYAPPHSGEENPAQNVGIYNPPGHNVGVNAPPAAQQARGRTAYKKWNDRMWFDGTTASIYNRALEAENLRRVAASEGDHELEDMLTSQIDVLNKTAAEYDDSSLHEMVNDLPGGTVALEYDDLIDGGLVDVTSFLHIGAHRVAKEAAEYDWDKFKNQGARQWILDRYDANPGILAHEMMTREAAVDYAKDKTMVLMDPVRRADVIDEFVGNVERYRREASDHLESERMAALERDREENAGILQRTAATLDEVEDEFLPGAYTDLPSDYADDGFLDIGPDDGSFMYTEAKAVQDQARERPWDTFTTEGAREWFFTKAADNPSMLKHADITQRAAKRYAEGQSSLLPDPSFQGEVTRAFTESVEFLRGEYLLRQAAEHADETDDRTDFELIFEDESEQLW